MKKEIKEVTIGTDAEVFLAIDDMVVSAIDQIGGTKENPLSIGENCFVQEDNILAEFNIPPVKYKSDFIKYINYCKNWLEIKVPECKLHFSSSEQVEEFILYNIKAQTFGCSPEQVVDFLPDRDYQTDEEYEELNNLRRDNNMRTSGFHIHIGYFDPDHSTNRELVKLFEKYVTLPLLLKDKDEHNRRDMYGQSGSYRDKPYGVECRSLGGYFIKDDNLIGEVWDRVQTVIENYNKGERVSKEEFAEIKNKINKKEIKIIN